MTTTDDEIRDLLRAARRAERPSAAERRTVRAALAGALASSVAAPTLATAAKAAAAGKSSALTALLLPFVTGAVLGSGVSATVFFTSRSEPAPLAARSSRANAAGAKGGGSAPPPAPASSATHLGGPPTPAVPPPGSARPPDGAGSVAGFPRDVGTEGVDPLQAESRTMAEVQRALRDGRPARALALLDTAERVHAGGVLSEERAAARVFALCALGQGSAVERTRADFLRRFPRSPLGERVRASCSDFARPSSR